jgi:hypothetical protein
VNPAHLEPVTLRENLHRSMKASDSHCSRGHPFDIFNTRFRSNGRRCCRECQRAGDRRRYWSTHALRLRPC